MTGRDLKQFSQSTPAVARMSFGRARAWIMGLKPLHPGVSSLFPFNTASPSVHRQNPTSVSPIWMFCLRPDTQIKMWSGKYLDLVRLVW
jgi:hypothetical protein